MSFDYAWSIRDRILNDTIETLYMVILSAIFAGLIGLAVGVVLVVTKPGGILENRRLNSLLDKFTNLMRAVPFIILLTVIAPITQLIAQTRIGANAAIVPLIFSTAPFFAKQVEQALSAIDAGVVEAAIAMGNTPMEVITSVYLREGMPHLFRAGAITLISLIGLTAMAGQVGAGGIGKLAISVGYDRYKDDVTIVALVIILLMVFTVQAIANALIKRTTH